MFKDGNKPACSMLESLHKIEWVERVLEGKEGWEWTI